MKFCVSFGKFNLKYFIYCILFAFIDAYIIYVFYYDKQNSNIFGQHKLFGSLLYYLGYLLNIIPAWINKQKSKKEEKSIANDSEEEDTLSANSKSHREYFPNFDYLTFFILCSLLLLTDLIYIAIKTINKNNDETEDEYLLFLIIFLVNKFFRETNYMHHIITMIFFIIIEYITNIFFTIKHGKNKIQNFYLFSILGIIRPIILSIYYIYLKDLLDKKSISPFKYNFLVGIVNTPLAIILYFIISFTKFGYKIDNSYYCDNIFELIKDIKELDTIYILLLIVFPFACGILVLLLNKTIYDFSLYYIYIPFLVEKLIKGIFNEYTDMTSIIILISCFVIELIMILVFLEVIEINYFGINENLEKYHKSKGSFDNSLINEENDDYEFKEKNSIN